MADRIQLSPITLKSWPACEDCLSWSEEGLAAAGNEVVHILSPRKSSQTSSTAGHPQWHINVIRTNLFTYAEWPPLELAARQHFSLGEEQSNSTVVALAWSHPGLGVHRRSVLAVLTSNLLLSIWETDGSLAQFKRTLIVNGSLQTSVKESEVGQNRRKRRVRAFAWCAPLKTPSTSEWGLQYLFVADDDLTVKILRPARALSETSGDWTVDEVSHFTLQTNSMSNSPGHSLSPLQRRLHEQSPITKIELGQWYDPPSDTYGHRSFRRMIDAKIRRGLTTYMVKIEASEYAVENSANNLTSESRHIDLVVVETSLEQTEISTGHATEHIRDYEGRLIACQDFFKGALKPVCNAFSQTHQLGSHYRIRFWGTTRSTDHSVCAACVTLHPSDMIEYTTSSMERCSIVFQRDTSVDMRMKSGPASQETVVHRVVHWVASKAVNVAIVAGSLDEELLQICLMLANHVSELDTDSTEKLAAALERIRAPGENTTSETPQNQHRSIEPTSTITQEAVFHAGARGKCSICDADIIFTTDETSIICQSGHQFTKCGLSFLAIQEPGISKYCSECGKQFLDITKLGSNSGPCLITALFDEFDVCPYCQGKFRG